ncbi:MAG TPA: tRNA lysidine(34) synthetase TilS [Candidatus Binataceae bacterium]|nr:tRNA lysidine(34) synthetase TilS [Candidatus Binataceae bacterium]
MRLAAGHLENPAEMQPHGRYEFEKAIAEAFVRNRVEASARVLVGVSGGPDSVALLHALLALSGRGVMQCVMAAHLNHGLRGPESDRDESFVRGLCNRLDIELVAERAEGLGSRNGNLEERARLYRHAFLNQIADNFAMSHIALAHHAGDQAETVLLRLLRGCGLAGAAAMAEAGPGRLLRPLLRLERADVLSYLEEIGASYVTDSSNLHGMNSRSRIRNELIPLIERDYAPRLTKRLNEFADESRAASEFLSECAIAELHHSCASDGRLNLAGFRSMHPALASAMLREYLRERRGSLLRVNRAHIESMRLLCLDGPSNGTCALPGGWRMRREYDHALVEPVPSGELAPFEVRLAAGTSITVAEAGFAFDLRLSGAGSFHAADLSRLRTGPMETLFDADHVGDYVLVRSFRHGDRIQPLGMIGSRKIQDVFTDRKLPRERRHSWPLVIAGDGKILWIPGMARGRAALVTPATRKVLSLSAKALASGADAPLPKI